MSKDIEVFTIYHIPGIKVGVTKRDPSLRVREQGYNEFEILETHTDVDLVGQRERELQEEYGYKIDNLSYTFVTTKMSPLSKTPEALKKKGDSQRGKPLKGNRERMMGNTQCYGRGRLYKELTTGYTGFASDMSKRFKTNMYNIVAYAKRNRALRRGRLKGLHFIIIEN